MIPPPNILRSNVEAVLKYFQAKDAMTDHELSTRQVGADDAGLPKRFPKASSVVGEVCINQFKHVDRGCLSDPPGTLVSIYRYNEKKDLVYVARGTNSNEGDNLDLATKILTASHIGLHRAERLMWSFFEMKNHRKAQVRLGEEDFGTYQTERLLALSSYAKTVGFANDPYKNVSAPTVDALSPLEQLGFSYKLKLVGDGLTNPTDPQTSNNNQRTQVGEGSDPENEEDGVNEQQEFEHILREVGEDLDVEVVFENEEHQRYLNAPPLGEDDRRRIALQQAQELDALNDAANTRLIQDELNRLTPNDDTANESTLKTFERLTNKCPWIPFRAEDSSCPATEIDKEEYRLFDLREAEYSTAKGASARKSYHVFANRWNVYCTTKFKEWTRSRSPDIVIPRLKSALQLQQHLEKRNRLRSLESLIPRAIDPVRDALNKTLADNRGHLPRDPENYICRPPTYLHQQNSVIPFGNPTVLNAEIAVNVVGGRGVPNNNNVTTAPFSMRLQNTPATAPVPKRPAYTRFRSRKFCVTCGWLRSEHSKNEGVAAKCKRKWCGRCFHYKMHDKDADGNPTGFGKDCTGKISDNCTWNVANWFDHIVSTHSDKLRPVMANHLKCSFERPVTKQN
jgi:hypothetical protein